MAGMSESQSHWRYHEPYAHLSAPFGTGGFGAVAEKLARVFGTPQYLISQTVVVIAWIIANGVLLLARFDPYPFILLNLAFSLQAAYAAPLILLAQTRQAERDKTWTDADAKHREELGQSTLKLLQQNTELTQQVVTLSGQVHELTRQIHNSVCSDHG
jgi:uncharacterized membrane protein